MRRPSQKQVFLSVFVDVAEQQKSKCFCRDPQKKTLDKHTANVYNDGALFEAVKFRSAEMLFDLKEVLRNSGVREFDFELAPSEFELSSVKERLTPLRISGRVRNSGGVLTLTCTAESKAVYVCDRCGRTFRRQERGEYTAFLQEHLTDEDNPEIFPIKGGMVDLDDIVRTLYTLTAPTLTLCGEQDCEFKGMTFP
jgi:uncharacterized metal-binding protein YceD (DUF177 family)